MKEPMTWEALTADEDEDEEGRRTLPPPAGSRPCGPEATRRERRKKSAK
jgi:hypothetical protein